MKLLCHPSASPKKRGVQNQNAILASHQALSSAPLLGLKCGSWSSSSLAWLAAAASHWEICTVQIFPPPVLSLGRGERRKSEWWLWAGAFPKPNLPCAPQLRPSPTPGPHAPASLVKGPSKNARSGFAQITRNSAVGKQDRYWGCWKTGPMVPLAWGAGERGLPFSPSLALVFFASQVSCWCGRAGKVLPI